MRLPLATATVAMASFSCCCGSLLDPITALIPGLDDATTEEPVVVAAPAATPPPAATDVSTAPLTASAILASADAVSTFYPWAWALAEMQHRLGVPTRVAGERYAWAVMDGADCVGTYMEHMTGPAMTTPVGSSTEQVGTYMKGQRFAAGGGNPYFDECVADVKAAPKAEPAARPATGDRAEGGQRPEGGRPGAFRPGGGGMRPGGRPAGH